MIIIPDYIPEHWHDRIKIVEDERGIHYLWTGWNNGEGHGKVRVEGKQVYTHRYVYSKVHGIVLRTLDFVDHLCERKPCVNVNHMEKVTPAINTARGPGKFWQFRCREEYA